MKPNLICTAALAVSACLSAMAAEPSLEKTDLFTSNTYGYKVYHIPGIVVTAKGSVLAWCEA
ncbi:MAG: Exo-alpha-sialidase, partial [Verrucomicrobiaceae bacterium]|nr:Exo-alpha-sialidase [Verrucomicrobiaceae bacterium]